MRILKIIHGYPMQYNAGSEVYSQMLVHGLIHAGHQVEVFSRYENPFEPDFVIRTEYDEHCPQVRLNLINMPRSKSRYQHQEVDKKLGKLLDHYHPDIVHIGHLSHLSTSLVFEIKHRNIPIVFTLHDYWMICPRGQFMQFNLGGADPWQACDGQEDQKCAEKCYSRYISGGEKSAADLAYWTSWVKQRIKHSQDVMNAADLLIAPANYLRDRFLSACDIPLSKIVYLDYGFNTERLKGRQRHPEDGVVFGYIGRHVAAKGIHLLIEAFGKTTGEAYLKIWGRHCGDTTPYLKELAQKLPKDRRERVQWLPEYRNEEIVEQVFNHTDVIVVPSIWVENSPLVIHEAQQVRVPVITANAGGMAEYVRHGENGLLFEHRNARDLATQMQTLIDSPDLCSKLGKRGYLYSENGDIPAMADHIARIEDLYLRLMRSVPKQELGNEMLRQARDWKQELSN